MQPQNQPRDLTRDMLGLPQFGEKPKNTQTYSTADDDALRTWNRDAAIRAEFGQFSTFAAWHKADRAGMIRVLGDARK